MPTKFRVVSLVQKYFPSDFLHYNVPRVDGPCAAHQGGEDGIGGKDIHFRMGSGQLSDDGVVSGGNGVEDSVNTLQRLLVLDVDAVVGFVVIFKGSGADAGKNKTYLVTSVVLIKI